ncbi:MAG: HD domain-containing protein [Bdellovibrionales bacterium]|nr:HD domain-containing protein [Bdellovibrionales bacterium]
MSLTNSEQEAFLERVLEFPSVHRALSFLSTPPITHYSYHNESHTLDVMRESILFASVDGLPEEEMEVLAIAAAWHDVGFTKSPIDHEKTGAAMFKSHFERERFPEVEGEHVETIMQMILDTKVQIIAHGAGAQQFARTHLSRYLLDADLSNLGRTDFFDCFERLMNESSATRFDFHVAALGLMSRHRWNTDVAERMRLEQEMRNAQELVLRIKQLEEY